MKKSVVLIIGFLCCALIPLSAQTHHVDIRAYEAGRCPVLLDSGWERFDGLRNGDELPEGSGQRTAAPIENAIAAGLKGQDQPPAAFPGAVSYRMKFRLESPGERRYSLFIPSLGNFERLVVNGSTLYEKGRSACPSEIQFTAPAGQLSIVLQLEKGGQPLENPGLIPHFILFGDSESLERYTSGLVSLVVAQLACLFIAAVFSILLYENGQKNRILPGFALFMVSSALFCFVRESSLFGVLPLAPGLIEPVYIALLDLNFASFIIFSRSILSQRITGVLKVCMYCFYAVAGLLALGCAFFGRELRLLYLLSVIFYFVYSLAIAVLLVVYAAKGERKLLKLLPFLLLGFCYTSLHRFFPASLCVALLAEPVGFTVLAIVAMILLVHRVERGFASLESITDHSRDIESSLKRFIPREFLECLDKKDIVELKLGDHVKREMTIFFSDIRSFTELSEGLTVEENFNFINSYLARMVPLVKQNGGFVDKYIGDGIMALFSGQNGADAAIHAAIEMQTKIVEYNGHRRKSGYKPISMGVGIHTGTLMLGVIGVDDRMENTVISDAVNLSSRLQAITKAFNISLAISEQSFKQLADPGNYKYRFIGKVRVKGKAAPVSVFEIFDGIAPELFERKMKANTYFEQGMLAYYQKDFGEAMYYFRRVLDVNPDDGAASFYLGACIDKASV